MSKGVASTPFELLDASQPNFPCRILGNYMIATVFLLTPQSGELAKS